MPETSPPPPDPRGREALELENLELENKKLRLETEKLAPPWHRPKASWIVVATSLAALTGSLAAAAALFAQHYLTSMKTERALLRDEKERQGLEREIQELHEQLTVMRVEQQRIAAEKDDVAKIFDEADRRATRLGEEYERARTKFQAKDPGSIESLDRAVADLHGMLSRKVGVDRGRRQVELAHKRLKAADVIFGRTDATRREVEAVIGDLEQSRQDLEAVVLIYKALRIKAAPGPEREALTDPEECAKIMIQAVTEESLAFQVRLERGDFKSTSRER